MRRIDPHSATLPINGEAQTPTAEARPPESTDWMDCVVRLLQEGRPEKALELLARYRAESPWAANATGVCLLRLREARRAIDLFRGLVLGPGGLVLRPDVPTVFKTNFVTALLMGGNLTGCTSVLAQIHEEDHPAVQKLRAAIRRGQDSMSFREKVWWHLGSASDRPVELDFDPGDL